MYKLDTFSIRRKHDGMVSDNIAAANRVHPDLMPGSRADVADPSVTDILVVIPAFDIRNDFRERDRRSARRIFFLVVVRFNDLNIEIIAQRLRRKLRQIEEQIHADTVIRGEDDLRSGIRQFFKLRLVIRRKCGRARSRWTIL